EIVVSTWEGANLRGVDHDVLVESADPGGTGRATYNPNTNRMIVSSLEGVRAATRPLVCKLRTDMQFVSDVLLTHWDRWGERADGGRWGERADELRVFERRLLAPNVFSRRPSYLAPFPLHPPDWSYFGLREDVELLFDAPLMSRADTTADGEPAELGKLYWWFDDAPSATPEQWIWLHAMRRADPELGLANVFDLTPETLRATDLSLAHTLAVLDTYTQFGVWNPKYPWPNRLFNDVTLYQHEQWLELYDRYCVSGESGEEVDALLRRLAQGRDGTFGQAERLRRAGHSYVAQLLESALAGPRLRRDSTTGGAARWLRDVDVTRVAHEELMRAAGR